MVMQEHAKSARPTPIQEMGLLIADLLMIQVCFLIAVILFHNLRSIRGDFADTLGYFYGLPNVVVSVYWLALIYLSRFVRRLFPQNLYGEILRIFNIVSLGVVLMLFVMADFGDPTSFFSTSKMLILAYWLSLIVALSFNRVLFYRRYQAAIDDADSIISPLFLPHKLVIVALDLVIIAAAYFASFLIRFEGKIPHDDLVGFKASLPVVVIIRFSMFLYFRLYSGYYRYASISDLTQILKAVTVGSVLIALPTYLLSYANIPRGVFVIDWLLMIVLVGGSRFLLRAGREMLPQFWAQGKRTFVIGAGAAGEMVLRELRKTPLGYKAVGLIDDDPSKQGLRLHGVPVLGSSAELERLAVKHKVTEALIAIPSATGGQMRRLIDSCRRANLTFKSLPPLREIINGQAALSQVRSIKVEDLLGRTPVRLDSTRLANFVRGKRILITGGGGSIGSEICRQVMRFQPERLSILDRAENRLYELFLELQEKYGGSLLDPHVADINDRSKMEMLFTQLRPEVIFHAAAYKQVPFMELFPEEAVENNTFGTQRLAELADRHSVGCFVLISTDKAVRPTSVMGATKRAAEMIVQGFAKRSKVSFITVRFGNVLGSDGSVVPIFRRQIEGGGPVTVTHPEVTRYFMTIKEASLLVMQAAAIGKSGDILVLNMGEPVKIVDLAKAMITLSGAVPDEDIAITYTGLRPGEKLTEELFDEVGLKTSEHENILVARPLEFDWQALQQELDGMRSAIEQQDREKVKQLLAEIVPGYQGKPMEINHSM
jgi:FlaA1/EpsC-like NDP-sugar epimerase